MHPVTGIVVRFYFCAIYFFIILYLYTVIKKYILKEEKMNIIKPDELKIGEYVVCIKDIFSSSGHGWIRKGDILCLILY